MLLHWHLSWFVTSETSRNVFAGILIIINTECPYHFLRNKALLFLNQCSIFFYKNLKKKKKIKKFIILKHSISKLRPLWKSGISVIMQWTRPKSNINKTFIWFAWRHMNVLCTFCFRQCFVYLWQCFIYILCTGKCLLLERLEADDQRCYVK